MGVLIDDRYLGDGVYASFDGHHILLDLRAQDSTTRIALEPSVFGALVDFHADCKEVAWAAERQEPAATGQQT